MWIFTKHGFFSAVCARKREHWKLEGQEIESSSIIVTKANDLVRAIHDRMPVIPSDG